jgi:hypothetical protein
LKCEQKKFCKFLQMCYSFCRKEKKVARHPQDIYGQLADMGDSRASMHPDFNREAANRREATEAALRVPVNTSGIHPQNEMAGLAALGDSRAIGHPNFNWERYNALQAAKYR